jgi:hypothetical protein
LDCEARRISPTAARDMILTVEFKNKTGNGDMKTCVRPPEPFTGGPAHESTKIAPTGTLVLADEHPLKERGYNPYDTTAYAQDIGRKDVWQHKPKRT